MGQEKKKGFEAWLSRDFEVHVTVRSRGWAGAAPRWALY